jgi:hypothetical protein
MPFEQKISLFFVKIDRQLKVRDRPVEFALLCLGKIVFFFHDHLPAF